MARFSDAWLDELRARVTLSGVISRDMKLDRAGREYKGCCPFHNEKTASFTVSDEKGFYHCFGCGAHGDVIRWMTDQRGLTFIEAIEELAGEAGLEVPAPSRESAARAERVSGMRPTLEEAQRVFAELLARYPAAGAWVHARGIDAATVAEFGLGFAPEDGGLSGRGFNRGDLMAVGLVGRSDPAPGREPFHYPRFKSRVMVPIHDARGRIVGFGGRDISDDIFEGRGPSAKVDTGFAPGRAAGDSAAGGRQKRPKYVNSVDSEIFDKGALLFNLHRARAKYRVPPTPGSPWRGTGRLVIVEGYMDAIALDRIGVAAVAPMGTALTERQLEQAWRTDPCPLLLFDGDAAGAKAAVRACETALPMLGPGRSLTIGTLPEGQDPDDIVKGAVVAGDDPALALGAWLAAGATATVQQCLLAHALDSIDGAGPEAWSAVWHRLQGWADLIADVDTRSLTLMHWRRRWEVAAGLAEDIPVTVQLAPSPVDDDWECSECGLATDPQAGCLKAGHCPHRDGSKIVISGGFHAQHDDQRVQAIVQWLVGEFDDIAAIQEDIKFRLAMAKEMGFDPPMLRKMARAVVMDRDRPDTRVLKEAREVAYRRAIGLKGPLTEEILPPPFLTGARAIEGDKPAALPPPSRRIEQMMDRIEGRA